MKFLALIDESKISPFFEESAPDKAVFAQFQAILAQKIGSLNLDIKKVDPALKGPVYTATFFETLFNLSLGYEAIIYFYADEVLIDRQACVTMMAEHAQYYAEYSFAEGYPRGLLPQIITRSALPKLAALAAKSPIKATKDCFFELIKRDINNFDLETKISAEDLRYLRLELGFSTKNNGRILQKIAEGAGPNADLEAICAYISRHPACAYALPAYYNFQLTSRYQVRACYELETAGPDAPPLWLDLDFFKAQLAAIASFSYEAVIGLGYAGEVSLHPQLAGFLEAVAAYPQFHLHVETSGLGFSDEAKAALFAYPYKDRLSVIAMLDTLDETLYHTIRGAGFAEAYQFCQVAKEALGSAFYVQTTRLAELEAELISFYQRLTSQNYQLIIQKYNNFCQLLPKNLVVDIAPLERSICWALTREMTIRADGKLYLCRQDIGGSTLVGQLASDGANLEALWAAFNAKREEQHQAKFSQLCEQCDEYYIFNF